MSSATSQKLTILEESEFGSFLVLIQEPLGDARFQILQRELVDPVKRAKILQVDVVYEDAVDLIDERIEYSWSIKDVTNQTFRIELTFDDAS